MFGTCAILPALSYVETGSKDVMGTTRMMKTEGNVRKAKLNVSRQNTGDQCVDFLVNTCGVFTDASSLSLRLDAILR